MAVSEKMVEAAMDVAFPEWRENWAPSSKAEEKDRMRRALEAAEAVRGGDAAPPAGTVPVRVAVAMDKDGNDVAVTKIHAGENESLVWADMAECGYPQRSCIATIHAPLRDVPEVGAVVEGVDRG